MNQKSDKAGAPIMALDLGQKRIGVAISDKLRISVRRLGPLRRTSWKQLLDAVSTLAHRLDAKALVIGLPLNFDGTTGSAAVEIQRLARNFARSLPIPVFLQDERLTSVEARENLQSEGYSQEKISSLLDSEAAAIILRDFIARTQTTEPLPVATEEDGL